MVHLRQIFILAIFTALALLAGYGTDSGALAKEPSRPDFAKIKTAVEIYFRSLPDYQVGDLVSQQHVVAALNAVADAGWVVPDEEAITSRSLPDGCFLVEQLATPDGKKFMRKIARIPGGYSRVDELSSLERGQKIVRDLIRDKGGDLLIEYLATTSGGHNLGRMMANAKNGRDLNRPTRRIYTSDDLLAALKRQYDDAASLP